MDPTKITRVVTPGNPNNSREGIGVCYLHSNVLMSQSEKQRGHSRPPGTGHFEKHFPLLISITDPLSKPVFSAVSKVSLLRDRLLLACQRLTIKFPSALMAVFSAVSLELADSVSLLGPLLLPTRAYVQGS